MPIEIRELVIKATINDAGASNLTGTSVSLSISPSDREELIKEITQRVVEILQENTEPETIGALPASFDIPPVKRKF